MDDQLAQARQYAAAGMTALGKSDGAQANAAFLKAIELGWPGSDVWITLSIAKSLLGDMPARLSALEKALEIDPSSARANLHYGQALVGAGRNADAKVAFGRGLEAFAILATRSAEMEQLAHAARDFLGDSAPSTLHPLDKFADEHGVRGDEEDELFKLSLDILAGRAQTFTSRPTRYYYPGLPDRQFHPASQFAWTDTLAARTPEIRAELQALLQRQKEETTRFSPYVESGGREGSGVSHPLLDNPEWSAFYLIKQGQPIEENIAQCPRTHAAIKAIGEDAEPAPAPSVLFSLLKPGASIPPHHGMLNTRLICHLPIILPGQCSLRVGNDTREWKDGEVFIFDDTIEHEAWNRSEQPRYILIFEIWRPELSHRQRNLVTKLFSTFGGPTDKT